MATVYIDGASRGNPGPSALAIYRPSTGYFLAKKIGIATNNFAEYMALQAVLLKYYTDPDLTILTDSQLIFNQIRGSYKVRSTNIIPMFTTCQGLIIARKQEGRDTTIKWIPREKNYADQVVNWVIDKCQKREAEGDWRKVKGQTYIEP